MTSPDLFEGDDTVREALCDHAGHDWEPHPWGDGVTEWCPCCGAVRTVALRRTETENADA